MPTRAPVPATPANLLAALLTAYERHDAAAAARLYAPDGIHEDVAQGTVKRGPEAIGRGLAGFLESVPDLTWRPQTIVADERAAAVAYVATGTLRRPLGPYAPHGQRLRIPGLLTIAVADGAIAASHDYWDRETLHRQLSARPRA